MRELIRSRRIGYLPFVAGIPSLIILGILSLSLFGSQSPTATVDPFLEKAIRSAILTDMTIAILPSGETPGHVSEAAVAELRARLTRVLPTVYTGSLLTTKLQALSTYIDAVRSSENIASNIDARIIDLSFQQTILSGTHATVHGTYSVWAAGRHREDGVLKSEGGEAAYTFTAGLDRVEGVWLVSSWDDLQIG
jgi:hypothetical protein